MDECTFGTVLLTSDHDCSIFYRFHDFLYCIDPILVARKAAASREIKVVLGYLDSDKRFCFT